ncbi:hypothetical protein BO82DRAFT_393176 [Aspergillus uvarum CBS 121591]|uniref:Uncharacterized protein n=1 Tax=Aspergillus uvarum CBS 121591 TaxID=1448315 RepID=A0A319CND2_9EURO|nr:hypothetical protein BO82DRAFT_393176 [Aspergillus uvarum CBS 121591]PYH80223.1 hypothetical protein BO82DRAFT_393176 [Aspergillus uvarum CBS 121591]
MSAILRKTFRTVRHLPRLFSRASEKDDLDSQREQVLSNLWVTYKVTRAMELDQILMDPEQLSRLGVLILPLGLTSDPDNDLDIPPALNPASYFVPLTYDYIHEHPVDLSDPETAERFNNTADVLKPEFMLFRNEPLSSSAVAGELSYWLNLEMSSSRLNCEDETQKLTWLNKWRETDHSNLEPVFEKDGVVFSTQISWDLEGLYVCRIRPLPPHVKAILSHGDVDNSEHTLLKAELKVILALMYSRWSMEGLLDMVVPVMLVSFLGRKVRCLIAIHDGHQLRISKTPLYLAENNEIRRHVVRYMGGGINKKLDTKRLPVVDVVEG